MASYPSGVKTYTTVQAAKELGVSRETVYRWMRTKSIKGGRVLRVGFGAQVQLRVWTERDLAAIRKWMKQHPYKGRGRKRS